MRGLIFITLMAAVGIAAAADPFAPNTVEMEQAGASRAQAQQAWTAKATGVRALEVQDFVVQTYDLGVEIRSWKFQRAEPFLREQGEALRAITQQTGWEVCARVCLSQDGHLGLRVQTLRAALACHAGREKEDCPQGMIATPVVVHTHGAGSIVQATAVDIELGHRGDFAWIEDGNQPSPEDLQAGSGWLLAPNGEVVGYGEHPE